MRDIVAGLASEKGLSNVHFHPQVPLDEIPPILAASDALLVPLSGHPTFEQFVPSKMVDFMATGKPVILSAAGESARILERAGAGSSSGPSRRPTSLTRSAGSPSIRRRPPRWGSAGASSRPRGCARFRRSGSSSCCST